MLSKGVDGIIISPVNIKSENIELISSKGLNAVYIDFAPEMENINYVHVSHADAAFMATEYLIGKGHTKILLLTGPSSYQFQDFYKGYAKSLSKNGISLNKALVRYAVTSIDGGDRVIREMYPLKQSEKVMILQLFYVSAICLQSWAHEASKKLGFKVPDDLSVMGYDNIFMTPYLAPPLTTIHAPKIRIGELSIKILLDRIEDRDREFHRIMLDVRLVERESVKKIN